MTIQNPPSFLQNRTDHAAIHDRLAASGAMTGISSTVLRGRGGIHNGAGGKFDVQQKPSPDMNVRVKSGIAYVPGSSATVTQGMYAVMNDGDVDLAISASSPTQNRYDIVYVAIRDAVYAGSDNDAILTVATGTPASGTPSEPSLPANSLYLARVFIGAGVTSITTANIDKKAVGAGALGGLIYADSTNMPATADYPEGQIAFQRDLDRYVGNLNSAWTRIRTDADAPLGEIGYDDIVASTGAVITTSVTDVPGLSVTVNVTAGRKYQIAVEGAIAATTNTSRALSFIREGSTTIRQSAIIEMPAQDVGYPVVLNARIVAGSTTSRTFKVSAQRITGTSNMSFVAAAEYPAYIRVIDQGV